MIAFIDDGHGDNAGCTRCYPDYLSPYLDPAGEAPGSRFKEHSAGLYHIGIPGCGHGDKNDNRQRNSAEGKNPLLADCVPKPMQFIIVLRSVLVQNWKLDSLHSV